MLEEIGKLRSQIQEIDSSISQLAQRRLILLQRLNDIQPAISVLPAELLPVIFQFVCRHSSPLFEQENGSYLHISSNSQPSWEYPESTSSALNLLQRVSTSWRNSVLSAPALWTNVNLSIDNIADAQRKATILMNHLHRSKDLPLLLSLHYKRNLILPSSETLLHSSVDHHLRESIKRVERLHLTYPPRSWLSGSLASSQKMLELSLMGVERILLKNLGLMDRLGVSKLSINSCRTLELASSTHITMLSLCNVPIDIFYTCLIECANLTQVYFKSPWPEVSNSTATPPATNFTVHHLQELNWSIQNSSSGRVAVWQIALLSNVCLPSLRELYCYHPSQFATPEPLKNAIISFYARLPTSLKTLGLRNTPGYDYYGGAHSYLLQNLQQFPSDSRIEHIILDDCTYPVLFRILLELRPDHSAAPSNFPNLRKVTIGTIFWVSGLGGTETLLQARTDAASALPPLAADLLERRLAHCIVLPKSFVLIFREEEDTWWLTSVKQRLIDLKSRYNQLEILAGSRPVDWL
ncbi:hypothetical protein NP233_g2899 [Leucocoprinus birnbaumii]|uniref:F-box domain-containing protein n=1 Tax=Leucocoprinus birnbaumii TaxID=56174 RepID=A0AAD5VXH8_9AGAR|nr:hypothetical protein NP233_g2899 [Leucocoprinus birnbaumii]